MTTETIITILSVLLALTAAIAATYFAKYRKSKKYVLSTSESRLQRELRKAENSLERYKTLYENVRPSDNASQKTDDRKKEVYRKIVSEAEAVMMERKELENEKAEIEERNKKLWDMSLTIQKEKERIDFLKKDIEAKHTSVTDSIHYARYIQLAILPSPGTLSKWFSDHFIFWRPLEIVSGDFYWMKQSGDIVVFTVADCTGHGVPGAFMSLLGVTFLNDICINLDDSTRPSEILEALRANIIAAVSRNLDGRPMDDGMDIALCIMNLKTKKLYFSGANNPMYLVRGGELTEYKPVRNPIGKYPRIIPFETHEVDVQPGDWIYMFSDGYIDQFGEKTGRKLMQKNFRNMISTLSTGGADGKAQEDFLGEFLTTWRGNVAQMDDILVGGYRI